MVNTLIVVPQRCKGLHQQRPHASDTKTIAGKTMAYAQISDSKGQSFQLYYEEHGQGQPLLLIRGLGRSSRFWGPVVSGFAEQFRVIVFDNRGIGRSQAPKGFYNTAALAADCAALLNELGVDNAHVFGMSLGGMIAQQVALGHGHKVDKLVLGATTPGQRCGRKPDPQLIARIAAASAQSRPVRNKITASAILSAPFLRDNPQILDTWADHFEREPLGNYDYVRQALAARGHDTWDALPGLDHQTLVITGDADKLMPPFNSNLLAHRIPNTKLVFLPGVGHDFTTEQPSESVRIVTDFLRQ